ncbi:hypothetical protein ACRRTK_000200 [Alexandromys fortis]
MVSGVEGIKGDPCPLSPSRGAGCRGKRRGVRWTAFQSLQLTCPLLVLFFPGNPPYQALPLLSSPGAL